jgi:hypothetical protein
MVCVPSALLAAGVALVACGDEGARFLEATPPPESAPSADPDPSLPRTDQDAGAPTVQADLFEGVATHALAKPSRSAREIHQAKGVNPGNPTHASCIQSQCHGANSKPFAFAVSICADAKCAAYLPEAEVRVQGADGVIHSAITDADGNAWFPDKGTLVPPAKVGIQKDGVKKRMAAPLVEGTYAGSCNAQSCHGKDPPGTPPPDGDGGAPLNVALYLLASDAGGG